MSQMAPRPFGMAGEMEEAAAATIHHRATPSSSSIPPPIRRNGPGNHLNNAPTVPVHHPERHPSRDGLPHTQRTTIENDPDIASTMPAHPQEEMPPRGVRRYARRTSVGNQLNMTPAASTLRRIDVFWMAEEVIDLHYEFKEKGTLFKKAICPSTRGYNKREHNRAKRKLHAFLKEYRATIIAEHTIETFDEPDWHDLEMMVADGGIIDQNFSCSKKEKFQGAGYYVSLSIPPDNVERLCHRLLQDVERIYDKYILGAVDQIMLGRKRLVNPYRTYTKLTRTLTRIVTGLLIGLPVAIPIILLALVQSPNHRLIITVMATCFNFPFYNSLFALRANHLVVLCGTLTALYVVFISNNTVILPAQSGS